MVVGLGNPGSRYLRTRHNVGFATIDLLAQGLRVSLRKPLFHLLRLGRTEVSGISFWLSKPLTYMNRSGKVIGEILKRAGAGVDEMVVVCDTLDLPPGVCRLKLKGSSGGHNGLQSIIEELGTSDFARLYIGIGRPSDGDVVGHVLGEPSAEERGIYSSAVQTASEAVLSLAEKTAERVMNDLNRRAVRPHPED